MKKAVVVLALLLGVVTLAHRPAPTFPTAPAPRATADTKAVEAFVPTSRVAPAPATPAPRGETVAAQVAAGDVDTAAPLLNALTRLLALNAVQKAQVEEILLERARQVDAYELEVNRRGWAKLSDFDRRINEIRDLSARRVMAVLSAAQAADYARALAAGIPEDSVTLEIPESLVKLD